MRELETTMNDEIPRDMDFHPDFYKRMREANEKLEKSLNPDDRNCNVFGSALIILGLIFLALVLCAISYMFSKIT